MASRPESRRLSEAHRLAQARLGVATVRQLVTIWPLLNPTDLDGTFSRWLRAVTDVVQTKRAASAQLAAQYLAFFRQLELGDTGEPFAAVLAGPADTKTLTTSMLVTGPVSVKANIGRGMPLGRATEIGAVYSARSAMRHALDGGRETITGTVRADRRAGGYRRVASGNACNYCADLDGIEFAHDEVFRPHDGCSCSAEPIYS